MYYWGGENKIGIDCSGLIRKSLIVANYKRGLLTLHGEVEGGDFGFFGILSDVRSEELVPEDWQKRITGDLTTKFEVRSAESGTITRGELELKKEQVR